MQNIGKHLFFTGCLITVAGLMLWLVGSKLSWLGNLPGDIRINKQGFTFYFPITTGILISIILSLIIWIIKKAFS